MGCYRLIGALWKIDQIWKFVCSNQISGTKFAKLKIVFIHHSFIEIDKVDECHSFVSELISDQFLHLANMVQGEGCVSYYMAHITYMRFYANETKTLKLSMIFHCIWFSIAKRVTIEPFNFNINRLITQRYL